MTKHRKDQTVSAAFKVPNTKRGQRFIDQLREFSTAGSRFKIRGRGSRTRAREITSSSRTGPLSLHALRQDLPPHLADSLAVYIRKPKLEEIASQQRRATLDYYAQIHAQHTTRLNAEIVRIENDRAELIRQRDAIQATAARLRDQLKDTQTELERLKRKDNSEQRFTTVIFANHLYMGEA